MSAWPHHHLDAHREQILLDYFEDQLNPAERVKLEKHLLVCPDCRSQLFELQAWSPIRDQLLTQNQLAQPTDDFAARIKNRLAQESILQQSTPSIHRGRSWSISFRSFSRIAAAAVLILVIGVSGLMTYRQLAQKNIGTQSIPDAALTTTAGLMAAPAADLQAEKNGDQSAMGESAAAMSVAGEPAVDDVTETEAQARLFAGEAPSALWLDVWSENLLLPVRLKSSPDQQALIRDLFAGATAAVWIEPDLLVAAYPTDLIMSRQQEIENRLTDSIPACQLEQIDIAVLRDILKTRLGTDEALSVLAVVEQADSRYLTLTIGG